MTYRRLFRYFIIGITLLFGVMWWLSFRPDAAFNAFVPGRHFHVRFYQGAVMVLTHKGPFPKYDFQAFQVPAISMVHISKFPHGQWGSLRAGGAEAFPSSTDPVPYHYVVFPIWLAYLLAAGAVVILWKRAERGIDPEAERAARHAADRSIRSED